MRKGEAVKTVILPAPAKAPQTETGQQGHQARETHGAARSHTRESGQKKRQPCNAEAAAVRLAPLFYLRGAAGCAEEAVPPRKALKNSDDEGSTTITSLFLLKLDL